MASKEKIEYIPHLRRPPPAHFRRSQAQDGVSKLRRNRSAPSSSKGSSAESKALAEQAARDKMLDDYYQSVRDSAAQVKDKINQLEQSLGSSESDSILAGVQAPNFESLGISFTAEDILGGRHDEEEDNAIGQYHTGEEEEDRDQDDDENNSRNGDGLTNADLIVQALKSADAWLRSTKALDLDNISDSADTNVDADGADGGGGGGGTDEAKEPGQLFGRAWNLSQVDALLRRCEDTKTRFSKNLGSMLALERRRIMHEVNKAPSHALRMDQQTTDLREEIVRILFYSSSFFSCL
jgi:hypothetical protein